jgi:hypothetical protein
VVVISQHKEVLKQLVAMEAGQEHYGCCSKPAAPHGNLNIT